MNNINRKIIGKKYHDSRDIGIYYDEYALHNIKKDINTGMSLDNIAEKINVSPESVKAFIENFVENNKTVDISLKEYGTIYSHYIREERRNLSNICIDEERIKIADEELIRKGINF